MKKVDTSIVVLLILAIIFSIYKSIQLSETRETLQLATLTLELAEIQLDNTEAILSYTEKELLESELHLNTTQKQLLSAEAELQVTEKQLSTTDTQLTQTEHQLAETESQLVTAEYQLEIAEDEQEQMLSDYSSLSAQIYLRQGEDEDTREFITPENEMISAKAKEITGGYSEDTNEYWSDFNKLYRWVVNNIEYSSDSHTPILPQTIGGKLIWTKDFWRMPEETLVDEVGDCEDMAVLLASLMLSYNNQGYAVWAIKIKNEEGGHLAVAFPVAGDKLTILDPAGNYYTGYFSGRLRSYNINRAVSDWLSNWLKEMPGAEVNSVFSNDFYREFANTEEFINWVKER